MTLPGQSDSDWQLVMDTARRVWSLANDGLDHPGDDAEVRAAMAKLLAAAERNGADPEPDS